LTHRWVGSGYLISIAPAAPYVPVGIAAIKIGGMPLLMGMTLFAGLFEIAFCPGSCGVSAHFSHRSVRPVRPADRRDHRHARPARCVR